jgi:intraflagellar transport protein 80
MIKTVQANRKNLQWTAHDGIVLCVDWNVTNQNIVSGGEDCIYHVWDSFGRMMYTSKPMEHVITSIKWSPNGDVFAVGLHSHLRLCDRTGWTHSKEHIPHLGSVMNIAWTSDGTQFAAAGGGYGTVLFAQLIHRSYESQHTEVLLIEPRKIRIQDPINESVEDLEYPRDRIVEIALGYEILIVTTTTQCYVYQISNLNTPIIFDIKTSPNFIQICRKHFLMLDQLNGVQVRLSVSLPLPLSLSLSLTLSLSFLLLFLLLLFLTSHPPHPQVITFEGRVLSNLRFQGFRSEYLSRDMVSLSSDMVSVVDTVDKKVVYLMDPLTGRIMGKIAHSSEVVNLHLNQHSVGPQERLLAFSDRNKDLFIANVGILASGLPSPPFLCLSLLPIVHPPSSLSVSLSVSSRWQPRSQHHHPSLQTPSPYRVIPLQR